jgi:hypothetical protein
MAGHLPLVDPFEPAIEAQLSAPDTQAGRLQRLCLTQLHEHEASEGGLPTNCTFIYYEIKDRLPPLPEPAPGTKVQRTWRQNVADAILRLRLKKIVLWPWIKDQTRMLRRWHSAPTVYTYMEDTLPMARLDLWRTPPMVICESRGLAGVLEDTMAEYLVPIIATGGQAHGVLQTDVIPNLVEGQPVIYCGDLNDAGRSIEENARRICEEAVGALQWKRLLLTAEQARQFDVPGKENTDLRYTQNIARRVSTSYEAEALGQGRIQDMLRAALDALLPEPLARVRVREARQRRAVARLLRQNGPGRGRPPRRLPP